MDLTFWRRRAALAAGLVLAYVAAMTAFNVWKPRILILHSFSESLRQVQETNAGLREPLKANRLPISLRWYSINADQAAIDSGGHRAVAGVRRVIDDFNPTVIMAVDDVANALLAQHPLLWRERRLFFVGINRSPAEFGYSPAVGATGIRDRPPVRALAEMFGVLRPSGGLRLAVLGSETSLGRNMAAGIAASRWQPQRLVFNGRAITWSQWQAAVRRANREADVLLITAITGLRRSPDGPLVPPGEVVRWTETQASRILPIGLIVDYVPLGGGLGVIPSSRYVGRIAMETVLRWLEPSRLSGVPDVHLADHFDVGLREQALRQRGLALPLVYREAARLSGQWVPAASGSPAE